MASIDQKCSYFGEGIEGFVWADLFLPLLSQHIVFFSSKFNQATYIK